MSTKEAITAFYRDRLTNDSVLLRDWFTSDSVISLNGSGAAGTELDQQRPARRRAQHDQEAITKLTQALVDDWHWHSAEVLQSLTDGDEAATRVLAEIEYVPTGKRARTEFAEFIVFNGERITEMISFIDTHAVMALMNAD